MMTKSIKAAIIGCGDIAGGYDERKRGEGIFSHAGAYRTNAHVDLVSAYDVDQQRLDVFCRFWNVGVQCLTLDEILRRKYDIISLCTPDDTHQEILEAIIDSDSCRHIWCEKPLTISSAGAKHIIRLAREKDISLWLTNQRRWEPAHLEVKKRLTDGVIGEIVHITAYYVRGITHIGCTAIDTIRFLCGEVAWVAALPPFQVGSYGDDPSLRCMLGLENGAMANLIGCDLRKYVYSLFEIDIVGTHGRIRIENNGDKIMVYGLKAYIHYPGFMELQVCESIDTQMKWSMKYRFDSILQHVLAGRHSIAEAEEGMMDLTVIDALKSSAAENGAKLFLKKMSR